MLNRAEFNQLQSRMLSHMARSMYVFYIQPQARQGHNIIDPIDLSNKLISNSMAMPCSPTVYDIEEALNELEQNSLIRRLNPNLPWQNASIILPLFARELTHVPQPPFRMFASWQPGPGFRDAALLAGLAEFSYKDQELRTFINYWMTTTSEQTQSSWERAFIKRLLKMRSAAEMSSLRPTRRNYHRDYSQRGKQHGINASNNQLQNGAPMQGGSDAFSGAGGAGSIGSPTSPANGVGGYQSQFNGQEFDVSAFKNSADDINPAMQSVPVRTAQSTTSSLTRRVTLKGMMTGKEDYEITAPGYTEEQRNTSNAPQGYETYTTASGYSDPSAPSLNQYQSPSGFGAPDPYAAPMQPGPAGFNHDQMQGTQMFGDPTASQGQNFDADFGNQPSQFNSDFLKELASEFGPNSTHAYDPSMDQQRFAAPQSQPTQLPQYQSAMQPQEQQQLHPQQQQQLRPQQQPITPQGTQQQAYGAPTQSQADAQASDDEDVPFYNQPPKPADPSAPAAYIPVDRSKLKLD